MSKYQSPIISKDSRESNLEKCSHIVETVNQLNEINDTPVEMNPISKPRSLEKKALQDYKSKISAITKSNFLLTKLLDLLQLQN